MRSEPTDVFDEELRRELRRQPRVDAGAIERAIAVVRQAHDDKPASNRRRVWSFAAAAALAAAVALVAIGLGERPSRAAFRSAVTATANSSATRVEFVLAVRSAKRVSLVGDFNDWNAGATPLRKAGAAGNWYVTVPLRPGRYEYAFIVDGRRWMIDSLAPRAPEQDFTGPTSVILIEAAQ